MTQLTEWHRRVALDIAQAFPLTPTTRIRASGNHLVAQNEEPEPGICIDCTVCDGPCAPADNALCRSCRALAATFAEVPEESATDYARRRARENDARALDLQLNGSGVRS